MDLLDLLSRDEMLAVLAVTLVVLLAFGLDEAAARRRRRGELPPPELPINFTDHRRT